MLRKHAFTRRRWRHKLTDGTRARQRRRNTFTFFLFFLLQAKQVFVTALKADLVRPCEPSYENISLVRMRNLSPLMLRVS